MKQIQKIIKTVRYTDFIFAKQSKLDDTKRFCKTAAGSMLLVPQLASRQDLVQTFLCNNYFLK